MRRLVVIIAFSILGCTALKPGTDVRPHDGGQTSPDSGPRDGGASDTGTSDAEAGPPDGGTDAGSDAGATIGVRQLALGAAHTCLLDTTGRVICWGANGEGQLGRTVSGPGEPAATVAGLPRSDEICAGGAFTCARAGADVLCWGANAAGQLGDGGASGIRRAVPAVVGLPAGVRAMRIGCGFDIACAVADTGELYCWGDNATYQIAPLTTDDVLTPAQVTLPGVVGGPLAVGANHTCAVLEGSVAGTYCWGDNSFHQIDSSISTFFRSPTRFGEARTLLTAGARHTCGYDGRALDCRGEAPQSTTVPSLGGVLDLDSGESFSCAHSRDRLTCWGSEASLQLGGTGSPNIIEEASGPIELLGVGRQHGCVVDALGMLCWGANGAGQIGARLPNSTPPTRIDLAVLSEL